MYILRFPKHNIVYCTDDSLSFVDCVYVCVCTCALQLKRLKWFNQILVFRHILAISTFFPSFRNSSFGYNDLEKFDWNVAFNDNTRNYLSLHKCRVPELSIKGKEEIVHGVVMKDLILQNWLHISCKHFGET